MQRIYDTVLHSQFCPLSRVVNILAKSNEGLFEKCAITINFGGFDFEKQFTADIFKKYDYDIAMLIDPALRIDLLNVDQWELTLNWFYEGKWTPRVYVIKNVLCTNEELLLSNGKNGWLNQDAAYKGSGLPAGIYAPEALRTSAEDIRLVSQLDAPVKPFIARPFLSYLVTSDEDNGRRVIFGPSNHLAGAKTLGYAISDVVTAAVKKDNNTLRHGWDGSAELFTLASNPGGILSVGLPYSPPADISLTKKAETTKEDHASRVRLFFKVDEQIHQCNALYQSYSIGNKRYVSADTMHDAYVMCATLEAICGSLETKVAKRYQAADFGYDDQSWSDVWSDVSRAITGNPAISCDFNGVDDGFIDLYVTLTSVGDQLVANIPDLTSFFSKSPFSSVFDRFTVKGKNIVLIPAEIGSGDRVLYTAGVVGEKVGNASCKLLANGYVIANEMDNSANSRLSYLTTVDSLSNSSLHVSQTPGPEGENVATTATVYTDPENPGVAVARASEYLHTALPVDFGFNRVNVVSFYEKTIPITQAVPGKAYVIHIPARKHYVVGRFDGKAFKVVYDSSVRPDSSAVIAAENVGAIKDFVYAYGVAVLDAAGKTSRVEMNGAIVGKNSMKIVSPGVEVNNG